VSPAAREVAGAAAVGATLLAVLAAAELWRRRGAAPETTRKLVHVAGGLICLAFPWAVSSAWTVLGMAAALSLFIAAGAKLGLLRSLHGVGRRTRGSEYYPLAIFLLYLAAGQARWLYVCSVLVLAVADAFAALVGSRYGRLRYEAGEGTKSVEGSLVFCAIAFAAMHLPMLLMTDLPRGACAMAALLVAVLVTGFEAISRRGTDNLFVPLGVCVILSKITTKPPDEILYQNASLLALCALIGLAARRLRLFDLTGAAVMILFAYGAWSLGSEIWAAPVLAGFAGYAAACLLTSAPGDPPRPVHVGTMTRAVLYPFLALLAGNMLDMGRLFYAPFVASLAVVLAFAAWNLVLWGRGVAPRATPAAAAAIGAGAAVVVAAIPWALAPAASWPELAAVTLVAAGGALVDRALAGPPRAFDPARVWPGYRMLLTALAAGVILALQAAGILTPWLRR
jgi:phytol kinase